MDGLVSELGVFNAIMQNWSSFIMLALGLVFIVGISSFAFWKWNPLLFMLAAGASLICSFYWYDFLGNNLGLTIGLVMFVYALVCAAFGFCSIFQKLKTAMQE